MNRRAAHVSRRRASSGLKKRLIGVSVLAAAGVVTLLALLLDPDQVLAARPGVSDTIVPPLAAPSVSLPSPSPSPAPATIARRVYPYSIIPGGVSGPEELARVIKTDRVVAEHYASFDVDKAIKLTVGKPRAVYVSYRKGDKVYWTTRKLMLAEGEMLLSDGRTEMRARCANRISDLPQLPVELNEPTAEELDSLVGIAMDTGLDDAGFAADGSMNGFGLALASSEPPSGSNAGRASLGSISGSRSALTGVDPVSSRDSVGRPAPGDPISRNPTGTPIVVAPPQSQGGDKGNTPGPDPAPGGQPSTPSPEVLPPAPGGSTTPGPGGTPPTPPAPPGTNVPPPSGGPTAENPDTPLPPEPSPWPPGGLPEAPGETVHEVPEPDTLGLFAAAFAALLLLLRRKGARPKL